MEIDRCHRVKSRNQSGQHQGPPVNYLSVNKFKDEKHILNNAKKLRHTGIYIYEDFPKDSTDLQKCL